MLVALIAAASLAMQWAPADSGLMAGAEHLIKDPIHRWLASGEPEDRIVIVDLDEASISALGPWPWPRARIADLLEALATQYGARAVGVDVVFPSPADTAGDARLAALGEFAPVVYAQALDFVPRSPVLVTGRAVFQAPPLPPAQWRASAATGYMANHAGLAKARCVGNIGLQPDADGLIRRVPLVAAWRGQLSPLLPLAMLACPLQRGGIPSGLASLAAAAQAPQWELPYSRQWNAYTVLPARAILDGTAPPELVRGRWVFVGSSALGLNDRAATPLAAVTAGVMVHAAAMTSLLDRLDGASPALPVPAQWIAAAWTLLTLGALSWALGRYKAVWLIPATVFIVASWLVLSAWLVERGGSFSASAPLVGYALMLFVISVELWMVQREQGQILRSFATYVAPSVLQEMLRQGLDNPMQPQHREITVLSADMQDYTGLTNASDLQDAAELTRGFLQCLTEPVLRFGGTLDKYTGDGLVAFWGAPLASPDHADQALAAGQAIVSGVRAWNEQRALEGKPPARVRVGIEAGPVLIGDLGTRFRRTYTAVGDCINTASKLQAVAKTLSCDLVVGPVAARMVKAQGLMPVLQTQLPGHKEVSVLWSFPSLGRSVPQSAPPHVPEAVQSA